MSLILASKKAWGNYKKTHFILDENDNLRKSVDVDQKLNKF